MVTEDTRLLRRNEGRVELGIGVGVQEGIEKGGEATVIVIERRERGDIETVTDGHTWCQIRMVNLLI